MSHDILMTILDVLLPIIFGLLGIKIGGGSALRAAAQSTTPKTKFPWADVLRAVLELLLKIVSTPGGLKNKGTADNGSPGQNV